jgi:hypothetical protein
VTLPPPAFASEPGALTGEVIYIDHFGNVVTSLGQFAWQSDGSLRLSPASGPEPIRCPCPPTT